MLSQASNSAAVFARTSCGSRQLVGDLDDLWIDLSHAWAQGERSGHQGPRGGRREQNIPVLSKKTFDKLPQWDFEDVYNQDATPTHSTCSQSLHNSEDEGFRKAFLPNIRLFLRKDSINMSEWNRLSHFNNPFGFMEYKYEDVMASVKLIPKPKEPLFLPKEGSGGCVRCAVVGTAGILNGSKMGREIDAHDYIFRVNGAVIKGHEEDVGSRTSVYVHTSFSITQSLRDTYFV
uniref:alpha-N-acetylgalactosaminide alpha-2,6-sialyltransferase n=1 Tax=Mola mola TaxID=94237 RepID=A0A3Q3XQB9_MOLML